MVGVRNDYLLHCYNLTSGTAELVSCLLIYALYEMMCKWIYVLYPIFEIDFDYVVIHSRKMQHKESNKSTLFIM